VSAVEDKDFIRSLATDLYRFSIERQGTWVSSVYDNAKSNAFTLLRLIDETIDEEEIKKEIVVRTEFTEKGTRNLKVVLSPVMDKMLVDFERQSSAPLRPIVERLYYELLMLHKDSR
jgi:hypothetical protein